MSGATARRRLRPYRRSCRCRRRRGRRFARVPAAVVSGPRVSGPVPARARPGRSRVSTRPRVRCRQGQRGRRRRPGASADRGGDAGGVGSNRARPRPSRTRRAGRRSRWPSPRAQHPRSIPRASPRVTVAGGRCRSVRAPPRPVCRGAWPAWHAARPRLQAPRPVPRGPGRQGPGRRGSAGLRWAPASVWHDDVRAPGLVAWSAARAGRQADQAGRQARRHPAARGGACRGACRGDEEVGSQTPVRWEGPSVDRRPTRPHPLLVNPVNGPRGPDRRGGPTTAKILRPGRHVRPALSRRRCGTGGSCPGCGSA
jgi:hypothetical protein